MKARFTEVRWLETHPDISLPELSELSGLPEAELHALADYGVLQPVDAKAAELSFRADYLVTARRAARLRTDLELDTQALALVLKLLTQMQGLETQLYELRARLPEISDED